MGYYSTKHSPLVDTETVEDSSYGHNSWAWVCHPDIRLPVALRRKGMHSFVEGTQEGRRVTGWGTDCWRANAS